MDKKKISRLRLLELIITIVIIIFLLGVAFVLRNMNQTETRNAERISEVNILRAALQFHYLDKGYYPKETEWCSIELNCNTLSAAIKAYLSETPNDPLYPKEEEGKKYSYQYKTTVDGLEYKIYTNLERSGSYELGSKGSFMIPSPGI